MARRDQAFRVWKGEFTGRYYAGLATHQGNGVWRMNGKRHDVTEDIERIIKEANSGDQ